MLRIKRLRVLSVAKVVGGIYAALGLLAGALFALFTFFAAVIGFSAAEEFVAGGILGALFLALVMLIFVPVFYGAIGFVAGVIAAFAYNLLAGRIGGIEVEVETISYGNLPTAPPPTSPATYPSA